MRKSDLSVETTTTQRVHIEKSPIINTAKFLFAGLASCCILLSFHALRVGSEFSGVVAECYVFVNAELDHRKRRYPCWAPLSS